MNDLHMEIARLRGEITILRDELCTSLRENEDLNCEVSELKMNLREAEAKPKPQINEYNAMLSRIGTMIPVEFFQTPETTTEQAVALLLYRYYSEMATVTYNNAEKLGVQP